MNSLEYAQLVNVLRASGSFNDAEPLHFSVQRLVDERNSERSRANKLRQELNDAGVNAEAALARIRRLEQEVTRLSLPLGSPVGWKPTGSGWSVTVESAPKAAQPAVSPEDRSR